MPAAAHPTTDDKLPAQPASFIDLFGAMAEPRAAMAPPCSLAEFPREILANRVGTPSAKRARVPRIASAYTPRRPHDTVLHRLVREHLATFLEHAETTYATPLPRYVFEAFERYLACGDFSKGFIRCRCDARRHDVLIAFSRKARGICPSCAGRRMYNEAAHITERILPSVPVRQWVLSVPFDLRALVATKPDLRTAIGRILAEEIARATKRLANVDTPRRASAPFTTTSAAA